MAEAPSFRISTWSINPSGIVLRSTVLPAKPTGARRRPSCNTRVSLARIPRRLISARPSPPLVLFSLINENNTNGGDGRAEINLRGILAKETLVLQDGRRLAPVGFAGNTVDINTIPFPLIDHIDVLKDGASAIYGADAVAGVFNVWLIHRFRGLELYASYGNTNLGFANDMGEERGYLLAGTGDDN